MTEAEEKDPKQRVMHFWAFAHSSAPRMIVIIWDNYNLVYVFLIT